MEKNTDEIKKEVQKEKKIFENEVEKLKWRERAFPSEDCPIKCDECGFYFNEEETTIMLERPFIWKLKANKTHKISYILCKKCFNDLEKADKSSKIILFILSLIAIIFLGFVFSLI